MSHLYQGTIFTDRTATSASFLDRPTVFILLPGGWTGDMWHCAAATALCQSEEQNIIIAYPITIIGMKEKVSWPADGSDTLVVSPDQSIFQGSKTYNYFHSTQIPALLARINKLETRFQSVFGPNIVNGTGEYLNKIVTIYRENYSNPNAVCSVIWCLTPESELASNVDTFYIPYGVEDPISLTKDELFPPDEDIPALSNDDISPPYEFNADEEVLIGPGPMLHLWASTTITMQYLHEPNHRASRIQYLQRQLGGTSDSSSAWVRQARELSDNLAKLATDAGIHEKGNKKVLLFNYRIGDVNRQHDANISLLRFIVNIATAKDFVVIPLIVNASFEDVNAIRYIGLPVLELYKKGVVYDKRYTAAFWAIVANELQDKIVHGLIGGRSGSMDIASFMGVNTCSFDEPVFGPPHEYDDPYIRAQGGQLLRLLAQHMIMSVVYVNTETWYDSGGKYNSYRELDENGVKAWLDRNPSDPHICPPLTLAQIQSTKAGEKSLESALLRMEHDVMKIKANGLRELLGL